MTATEHWDVFICPSCSTLYPDLSTLCECELPNNVEGVETERVTVVPAKQLQSAAEALHEAIKLARDFNRGAMTWQEYDRKLAALETAHPKGQ